MRMSDKDSVLPLSIVSASLEILSARIALSSQLRCDCAEAVALY